MIRVVQPTDQVGLFFLIEGAVYMVCAPMLGHFVDRMERPIIFGVSGNIFMALALSLAGPAPFLALEPSVSLLWVRTGERRA